MEIQEIQEKLRKLTNREREILKLFCDELQYWQIAERLIIEEGTVRAHMSNLAKKLELSSYARGLRRDLLLDEFCPVLREGNLGPPAKELKNKLLKTLTLEEEDLVTALVHVKPIIINPHPTCGERTRDFVRRSISYVVVGIIGATIMFLALNWQGFFESSDTSELVAAAVTQSMEALTQIPQEELSTEPTSAPANTSTNQPTSTETSVPPTSTPTSPPTNTPVPLPFTDNFNSGAKPEWDEIVGRWRMVDGAYVADRTGNWNISLIGSESWNPSVIEVDVITDDWNWPVRVVVRDYQGSSLVMQTNCCDTVFILIENGEETVIAESETGGLTGRIYWHTNHIRIEIDSGIYSLFVDGVKLLTVQDNSFPSGRVGLALEYEARFDNFEVR